MEFDKAYTAKQVAEILNVSLPVVYELARTSPDYGGIPSFKFGGSVRIKESDLTRWMESRKRA